LEWPKVTTRSGGQGAGVRVTEADRGGRGGRERSTGVEHVAQGTAEDEESAATEQAWRWCRWTRWPLSPAIIVVAALTLLFDVTTSWFDITLGHLGRVPVSPTLPLEILLVSMIGFRRVGLDRHNIWAWREFLAISAAVIVFGVYQYAEHVGGFAEAMGLVIAAFDEEMVYRLAVLVLVGSLCAKLSGHNWRHTEDWGVGAGVIAVFASGFVFALLPGHVSQMTDTLHALPFVSLGIVLGYAVLRTGALLPAAVVHALLNLATIAAWEGEISMPVRTALAASALLSLLLGTVVAGRRLGIYRKMPVQRTVAPT
jgi:membrane protease YdiL (CAAX protease family)